MTEFCVLLAEFIHKEVRTSLVNNENNGWAENWEGLHDWAARFMGEGPAIALACKGAAGHICNPAWYVLFK